MRRRPEMGGIIYIWGQRKGVCVHHATVQKDERQRLGDLAYIGHSRSAPSSATREGSVTGYACVQLYRCALTLTSVVGKPLKTGSSATMTPGRRASVAAAPSNIPTTRVNIEEPRGLSPLLSTMRFWTVRLRAFVEENCRASAFAARRQNRRHTSQVQFSLTKSPKYCIRQRQFKISDNIRYSPPPRDPGRLRRRQRKNAVSVLQSSFSNDLCAHVADFRRAGWVQY